jgi:hypothetical protein
MEQTKLIYYYYVDFGLFLEIGVNIFWVWSTYNYQLVSWVRCYSYFVLGQNKVAYLEVSWKFCFRVKISASNGGWGGGRIMIIRGLGNSKKLENWEEGKKESDSIWPFLSWPPSLRGDMTNQSKAEKSKLPCYRLTQLRPGWCQVAVQCTWQCKQLNICTQSLQLNMGQAKCVRKSWQKTP